MSQTRGPVCPVVVYVPPAVVTALRALIEAGWSRGHGGIIRAALDAERDR